MSNTFYQDFLLAYAPSSVGGVIRLGGLLFMALLSLALGGVL